MERNSAAGGKLVKDREERIDSRSVLCKYRDLRLPGTETRSIAFAEGAHNAHPGPVTAAVGTAASAESADITPWACYIFSVYMERVGKGVREKRAGPSPRAQVTHVCPGGWKNFTLLSALLTQASRLASYNTKFRETLVTFTMPG